MPLSVFVALALSAGAPSAPGACGCPDPETAPTGLLWRGAGPLPPGELARLAAPIVWFSRDEPLVVPGATPPPDPHPCDAEAPRDSPVVYWSLDRVQLRGTDQLARPVEEDARLMERAVSAVFRFFFYYREDVGVGHHPNDIELVDVTVNLVRESGCWEARVRSVTGFAHGVDWYSNELAVQPDTRLPITILVEEGKHASCPDRNADGIYTPGYDVNRRINDAWGVRDVIGSGFLLSSGYAASMTKPRTPIERVLPPEPGPPCATGRRSSVRDPDAALGRYVLRPAREVPICLQAPEPRALEASMRRNHFGLDHEAPQRWFELGDALEQPINGTESLVPSIALRWDGGLGFAALFRGLDLRELYLVPRLSFVGVADALELLVTNSAARFASGYASAGVAREESEWRFVSEAGLKLRVTAKGWQRVLSLGYQFAGLRVGVRSSGFDPLEDLRFVAELGAGVW
ncbi:hypothetical protein [Anaeromyxobacter sp. Fw109-5]|uniref:hypothetical protein n=1 Tax=Anaeromyxobacter sp. (strain Fw109-5) TaxID=404589 RepID=UPI0000ED78AF|nr:hypothetical protein [Anaeromyxobacter sp. Fw109-5]ABS24450.1 hypothetical protein Anae109_0232 [Anaeromyxobacter sp. Fw109-5]